MNKTYTIRRRSGREVKSLSVQLPKPPEEYTVGNELIIQINNRDVCVRVEIDCQSAFNDVLYVA